MIRKFALSCATLALSFSVFLTSTTARADLINDLVDAPSAADDNKDCKDFRIALQRMNLSQVQREDLAQLFSAFRQDFSQFTPNLRERYGVLFDAIHQPIFDEATVQTASQEVQDLKVQVHTLQAQLMSRVAEKLSADQYRLFISVRLAAHQCLAARTEHFRRIVEKWLVR